MLIETEDESPPAAKSKALFMGFTPRPVNDNIQPRDVPRDAWFTLKIEGKGGKEIDWIEIRNQDGQPVVWDTNPTSRNPHILVMQNKEKLNNRNGSFHALLPSGNPVLLDLIVRDNGSIQEGRTHYIVTVGFQDGDILKVPVQLPPPK